MKFEEQIRETFEHFSEKPSEQCWTEISKNLDGMHSAPSNSTSSPSPADGGANLFTQIVKTTIGKISIGAVAGVAIGSVVYFTVIEKEDTTEKHPNAIEIVIDSVAENDLQESNTFSLPANEPKTQHVETQKADFSNNGEISQPENTATEDLFSSDSHFRNDNSVAQPNENLIVPQTQAQKPVENNASPSVTAANKATPPVQPKAEPAAKVEEAHKETETPEEEIVYITLKIPNIITPNGDHINDYFEIDRIEELDNPTLIICNRQGKVLFEQQNYKNNWSAEGFPDGMYIYVFKYTYMGQEFMRRGYITVKR